MNKNWTVRLKVVVDLRWVVPLIIVSSRRQTKSLFILGSKFYYLVTM